MLMVVQVIVDDGADDASVVSAVRAANDSLRHAGVVGNIDIAYGLVSKDGGYQIDLTGETE